VGIPADPFQRQGDMLYGIPNIAEKAVAPVVEAMPKTGPPGRGFKKLFVGVEAEISPGDDHRLCRGLLDGSDGSAVAGGCSRDPVV